MKTFHFPSQRVNFIIIGTFYLLFFGLFLLGILETFAQQDTENGTVLFNLFLAFPSSILLVMVYFKSGDTDECFHPTLKTVLLYLAYFIVTIGMALLFYFFIVPSVETFYWAAFFIFSYTLSYSYVMVKEMASGWWYVAAFAAPIIGAIALVFIGIAIIAGLAESAGNGSSSSSEKDTADDDDGPTETVLKVYDQDSGRDVTLKPFVGGEYYDDSNNKWKSDDGGVTAYKVDDDE